MAGTGPLLDPFPLFAYTEIRVFVTAAGLCPAARLPLKRRSRPYRSTPRFGMENPMKRMVIAIVACASIVAVAVSSFCLIHER